MKTEVDAILATPRGPKQPPPNAAACASARAGSGIWRGWRSKRLSLAAAAVIPLLALCGYLGWVKIQKQPLSPGAAATKEHPFVNSLGMRFAPVSITGGPTQGQRVLFSVWETRVQDYARFATETAREWQRSSLVEDGTHPAVNVSWEDANAFCSWLTARDRASGKIGAREEYRLPSDHEWSCAVGIGSSEDADAEPRSKSANIELYPWGAQWPPPKGVGNYGSSLQVDDFESTSPMESFGANENGLYDMGGNVWQWCDDWYDAKQGGRVARGGSWNDADPIVLRSAFREANDPTAGRNDLGFRCVLADVGGLARVKAAVPDVSLARRPISPSTALPQIAPMAAVPTPAKVGSAPVRTRLASKEFNTAIGKLTIDDPGKLLERRATEWAIEPVTKDNIAGLFRRAGYPSPPDFDDFFAHTGPKTSTTTGPNSKFFVAVRMFDDGSCIGTFQKNEFQKWALLPPSAISSASSGVSFQDKNETKHPSAEFADAVSREIAQNGSCKAGIIFSNGNLFEYIFSAVEGNPTAVDISSAFHAQGTFSPWEYNVKFYPSDICASLSETGLTVDKEGKKIRIFGLRK
jgi:hypothetical protein